MEPAGNRIREERLQEEAEEEGRETRKLWSALPFSRSKTGVSLSLSLSKSHPTCNPERRCRPPHLSDQEDRQAAWRDKDLREYGRSRPRQIRQIEMRRNRRSGEPRTEIQNPARRGWKLRDSGNSLPGCDKEEGASQSEHGDEHGRKEHPPLPFEVLQGGGGGGVLEDDADGGQEHRCRQGDLRALLADHLTMPGSNRCQLSPGHPAEETDLASSASPSCLR